jgi:hypothetical protein
VLIDRRNFWRTHGRWFAAAATVSAVALVWCALWSTTTGRWPGGGSLPGLVLGGLSAAIFLFELALVAKKTPLLRTARWALSAQTWMKAHIWLGLLSVPLVVLHSGGTLGGTLTTWLMILFTIVIVSGLWGLALQNILPRLLLEGAPAETVYSQIDAVGLQYAAEARRLVVVQCGDSEADSFDVEPAHPEPATAFVESGDEIRHVRGAQRHVGPQVKRSPHPARDARQVPPAPAIRDALNSSIVPYLSQGATVDGLLGSRQRNQWFFDDLRLRVAPELRGLVGQLEDLCERRRQLNIQRRMHFWLHNWLWLHLPLSVALIVLMLGHILFALRFG